MLREERDSLMETIVGSHPIGLKSGRECKMTDLKLNHLDSSMNP